MKIIIKPVSFMDESVLTVFDGLSRETRSISQELKYASRETVVSLLWSGTATCLIYFLSKLKKGYNDHVIYCCITFLASGSDNSVHMLLILFTILFSQFIYKTRHVNNFVTKKSLEEVAAEM